MKNIQVPLYILRKVCDNKGERKANTDLLETKVRLAGVRGYLDRAVAYFKPTSFLKMKIKCQQIMFRVIIRTIGAAKLFRIVNITHKGHFFLIPFKLVPIL